MAYAGLADDTTKFYWFADIFGGSGTGGDTTAPTVTTKTPPANASGVSPTTTVTATFDEAVTGVSGTTFTLEDPTATPVMYCQLRRPDQDRHAPVGRRPEHDLHRAPHERHHRHEQQHQPAQPCQLVVHDRGRG